MQPATPDIISTLPTVRQAVAADLPMLDALMEESVRGLNIRDYWPRQLESALEHIFGIDEQLIASGTYYIAELDGEIAGCGGWSSNGKLYGGNQVLAMPAMMPAGGQAASGKGAAKIRSMFVHPKFARRGVGTRLMQICELTARRAGFRRLELIATLTGEPFYRKCGFVSVDHIALVMPDGLSLEAVKMAKQL